MLDKFLPQAHTIQQAYKHSKAEILRDKTLSDLGRKQRLEALETQRHAQVTALQTEAQAAITRRRAAVDAALKLEAEKHLEEQRKLLGDVVLADIYRRELETLDAGDIAAAYEAAPTQWERQVIAGYGKTLLQLRARSAPTRETLQALETLKDVDPAGLRMAQAELRDLEDAAKRLDELDRQTYTTDLAAATGVSAVYME